MIPQPLQAVVFDMDGLLLDTEAQYRDVFDAVCRDHGYAVPADLHHALVGSPGDKVAALLTEHFGADFPLERIRIGWRTGLEAVWRDGVPVKAGAYDLLALLAEHGIPAAVATSTARHRAHQQLQSAGLFDLVQTVVSRNDVTHGKPHPESFLTAAARLQADPAHCLALEDSHNGVRAAHAAGMATVMVPDLLDPTEEIAALCVAVLESLHDVHRHIATSVGDSTG